MRLVCIARIYLLLMLSPLVLMTTSNGQQTPQLSSQMQTATQLFRSQKWGEAVTALEEIIKSDPGNGRAWFMLGSSYHQLGQYENAVAAYERNVPISKNPTAMYNLACSYSRLKQVDKAFEWIEKAIEGGAAPTINLEKDSDLDNLKTDVRFKKMVELALKKTKPCMYLPEARQFDFWIGEWDVFPYQAPPGPPLKVGTNKIDLISDGCGLLENWSSPTDNGKSISYFDANTGKWHQYWIGSGASVLRYQGSFKDDAMQFLGETADKSGKLTLNRLTFFKIDGNTVRQLSETSTDDGRAWKVSYDFRYEKKVNRTSVESGRSGFGSSAVSTNVQKSIEVPKGPSIHVDGRIDEAEWSGSLMENLQGSGNVRISHDGEFLQIGLQSDKPGLSHIYLFDGSNIFVLHASAAVGSAMYRRTGDSEAWDPIQKFQWSLRDQTAYKGSSSAYLNANNWLASVASPPTSEREYKIAMKFRDGGLFRLAAVYVADPRTIQVFPSALTDDTIRRELLFGSEPMGLRFKPQQWATLKIKEK